MSLQDCKQKIKSLLEQIEEADQSYRLAQAALTQIDNGDVNLTGVGMNMQFGDVEIPVPLPSVEQLSEHVEASVNFLAQQLVHLWTELHTTASRAKTTCDQAIAAAKSPAVPPASPPTAQQPFPQQQTAQQIPPPAQLSQTPQQTTGLPTSQEIPQPAARLTERPQPIRPAIPPRQHQNTQSIVTTPVG